MPLTDAACRNAKALEKPRKLADEAGLYLLVKAAGKYWRWDYRHGGKRLTLALGVYPQVTLQQAREKAQAARAQLAEGADPGMARKVNKLQEQVSGANTVKAVAMEWLALRRPEWSPTHYTRELRNLEKDVYPFLGDRPIEDVVPVEMLATIRRVEARGVTDTPHRVLMTASGVWQHAIATGRAQRDVTQDIKKALRPHIRKNLPAIIEPAPLAELLRASDAYRGGPVVRAALLLAPILFQRPGNLRTMRWAELDMEAGLWAIPSEDMKRTKAQKLNGQAHMVPLPRQVLELLAGLQPLTGAGEYVFPGFRDKTTPMSEAAVNAALHAMGYKDRHCWHGYRATGRTILRQVLKYPTDVIEAQLAHKGQITHGGATHVEERDDMLQVWADYLDKLRQGADVIQLPQRAA